ncbi:ring-h2 finger protein atl67 [Nicotiana attenuata]|uniref:Ring-h2 finger protein atl67 n=1 Tax=Nicotiana attenuata TaxID=49451 RepID=A0A1J6IFY0_NICAT|nr:ring-h2 finger protein atl67 [Nicotiana attenuata]
MSTVSSSIYGGPPPPPLPQTTTNTLIQDLNKIGLGYAIAIALGFLLSTFLLSSYLCCRSTAADRRRQAQAHARNGNTENNGIYLPRVIFVADEEENDDVLSQNTVLGLDQAVINSYPKLVYSKRNGSGNDVVCAICLSEYNDSEILRMLPDCKHYFHVICVHAWLKLNASCPVCGTLHYPRRYLHRCRRWSHFLSIPTVEGGIDD